MRELVEVMNDFKEGNENAYIELINHKYVKSIIGAAYLMQGDNITLEYDELTSELYIVLKRRAVNFDCRTSKETTAYLNQVIKGHVLNAIKKQSNTNKSETPEELAPELSYNQDFYSSEIHELIESNPILRARFIEDKTFQEIADEQGISKAKAYRTVTEELEELKYYIENKRLDELC